MLLEVPDILHAIDLRSPKHNSIKKKNEILKIYENGVAKCYLGIPTGDPDQLHAPRTDDSDDRGHGHGRDRDRLVHRPPEGR